MLRKLRADGSRRDVRTRSDARSAAATPSLVLAGGPGDQARERVDLREDPRCARRRLRDGAAAAARSRSPAAAARSGGASERRERRHLDGPTVTCCDPGGTWNVQTISGKGAAAAVGGGITRSRSRRKDGAAERARAVRPRRPASVTDGTLSIRTRPAGVTTSRCATWTSYASSDRRRPRRVTLTKPGRQRHAAHRAARRDQPLRGTAPTRAGSSDEVKPQQVSARRHPRRPRAFSGQ